MQGAPSVSYPVGRSAFGAWVLAVGWAAGLFATAAWLAAGAVGWRVAVGMAAVSCAGALAAVAWWRSPPGRLDWDGARWAFGSATGPSVQGRLMVALDVQFALLVRWRGAPARWFWLERRSDRGHWDALRRAVYSRPDADAPSGAEPPPRAPS